MLCGMRKDLYHGFNTEVVSLYFLFIIAHWMSMRHQTVRVLLFMHTGELCGTVRALTLRHPFSSLMVALILMLQLTKDILSIATALLNSWEKISCAWIRKPSDEDMKIEVWPAMQKKECFARWGAVSSSISSSGARSRKQLRRYLPSFLVINTPLWQ